MMPFDEAGGINNINVAKNGKKYCAFKCRMPSQRHQNYLLMWN